MDTFMDKLAQKFTAQEMIKANSAAETEEMNRLKAQVEQYTACLNRMKELCGEMEQSAVAVQERLDAVDTSSLGTSLSVSLEQQLQAARRDSAEISEGIRQLTDESIDKIHQIQQNATAMEALQRKLETIQETITELATGMDVQEDLPKILDEKNGDLMEHIHKEGVKIYRNVQASVQEETSKQAEGLAGEVKKLQGKVGAIQGISIVAMLAALAGVVLQVLTMLGIL